MKNKETIENRKQMAVMHDSMIDKLDKAMRSKEYVEASWLCYSIFEQRTTRIIMKHIHKCPRQDRSKEKKNAGIRTRIDCILRLSKQEYGAYKYMNGNVFRKVKQWCDERNKLVHSLLDLDSYQKYDKAFKNLAEEGYSLVPQVYHEATIIRDWCLQNSFTKFPDLRCQCKNQQCIHKEE